MSALTGIDKILFIASAVILPPDSVPLSRARALVHYLCNLVCTLCHWAKFLWRRPLPDCLAFSSILLLPPAHFTLLYIFFSRQLLGNCSKINLCSLWFNHLSTFLFKVHPLLHFLLYVLLSCLDTQVIHSKVLSCSHVSFRKAIFFQYCYFEYKMYWELYDMLSVCQSKVKSSVRLGSDGAHL